MSRTSRPAVRRVWGSALVAAALSLTLAAPTAASARDTDGMPVTADDTLDLDGSSGGVADVLANDTDPDGDELAICRITVPKGIPIYADAVEDVLYIQALENVTASYEITYYACDFEHLTAGTLTVNVTRAPEISAKKLERPGRLKFTNPGPKRVVVLYGNRNKNRPDGRVGVAPKSSAKVTVARKRIYYIAFVRRTGALAGEGIIKNIKLPEKSSGRSEVSTYSAKALEVWAARR